MVANRLEGNVTTLSDDYAIVSFGKGCISFEGGGELYTNKDSFSVYVSPDGVVSDVTTKIPTIVKYGNYRKTEVHHYMLISLLRWDNSALQKHIESLVKR